MEENNKIKIIVIIIVIVIIIAGVVISKIGYEENYEDLDVFDTAGQEIIEENQIEETNKIKIHILGQVNYNGILELEEGSRIDDAIKKAGGITDQADITKINLAYKLSDGQKLYIPSITDEETEYILENEKIEEKININTATQTELETLPGVGPSLALKILNYRKENGKFKTIEEIQNVSGVGENKYEEIKEKITVK